MAGMEVMKRKKVDEMGWRASSGAEKLMKIIMLGHGWPRLKEKGAGGRSR